MEAFDFHSGRFFGLKILADEGKADVYSPIGEIVGEIPVRTEQTLIGFGYSSYD